MTHLLRKKPQTFDRAIGSKDMNKLLTRNRTIQISNPERPARSLDLSR